MIKYDRKEMYYIWNVDNNNIQIAVLSTIFIKNVNIIL